MKNPFKKLPWDFLVLGLIFLSWLFYTAASLIFCLLLLIIWIIGYIKSGFLMPKTSYNLPFFSLVVLTGFSVFFTPNITSSAGKIIGILGGVLLFCAIIRWVVPGSPENSRTSSSVKSTWLIFGFVCSGGLIALLGLFGADWFSKYPFLSRLSGLIPNLISDLPGTEVGFQPNAISGTLTLITPLSVMVLYQIFFLDSESLLKKLKPLSERLIKIILVLVLVFQGSWWVLAQTRGAWLGLFCGLLFWGLLIWKPTWVKFSWIIPFSIVVFVYLYWFRIEDLSFNVVGLEVLGGEFLTSTLAVRLQIWRWASWVMQKFPFTGVGLNIFREAAPFLFFGPKTVDIAHAHNIWLDVGVSIGWGGIFTYLVIWFVTFSTLLKRWQKKSKQLFGKFAGALAAGWYAYFVFGLADAIPLGSKMGLVLFINFAVVDLIEKESINQIKGAD